jgi:hypothetical protein
MNNIYRIADVIRYLVLWTLTLTTPSLVRLHVVALAKAGITCTLVSVVGYGELVQSPFRFMSTGENLPR